MISKIELQEITNSSSISVIIIDIKNNIFIKMQNGIIIDRQNIDINIEKLNNLLIKHVTYWDNEYIDNKIIDGGEAILSLYTDKEKNNYRFKNKYPYNYREFINELKDMVNII